MPAVQTPVARDDALAPLRATLDSIRPKVTMSHDDLVVIALGCDLARQTADYLTLADSPPTSGSPAFYDASGLACDGAPVLTNSSHGRSRFRPLHPIGRPEDCL